MKERQYIAIDLKSFYASVECVDRGLDPLDTNLVVADSSRTDKPICLAVSPSLKSFGISGRARLFEAIARVKEVNGERAYYSPEKKLVGSSNSFRELMENKSLAVSYVVAPPRMSRYMEVSSMIYGIYLNYIAPEDIHVYSIDEVFIDATNYLETYKMTAHELALKMIRDVLAQTGITATAGIGTNLYLSKIAMDIVAKHMKADCDGVRIAELDERSYREILWDHRPLTDFWRVGSGYSSKLESYGIETMGDIALCSIHNDELLYKLFGINAELLIDHAWGWEPCRISEIKSYKPQTQSVSLGQVLPTPYDFDKARLIIKEMTELLVLDIVEKELVTDQIVLSVGYDISDVKGGSFKGEIKSDHYGRLLPKQAHGSENLGCFTSSTRDIMAAVLRLFDRVTDRELRVRRMYIVANHTISESSAKNQVRQLDLFSCFDEDIEQREREENEHRREKGLQRAVISLRRRYGKNSVLKGMNFLEGATTIERNAQIGGHRA